MTTRQINKVWISQENLTRSKKQILLGRIVVAGQTKKTDEDLRCVVAQDKEATGIL